MEFINTYVKIDLDAIAHNLQQLTVQAGVKVMAVVKADAYGHGAVPVAKFLQGKCHFFGVANMAEALELCRAGIQTPILILGLVKSGAYAAAVENEIRVPIDSLEAALALSAEAVKQDKKAYVHIAVDTGMSRIGFQAEEASADICGQIAKLPGLVLEGLFSHFATADEADLTKTQAQTALFAQFDGMLRSRGVEIPLRHLDNSAGIIKFGSHHEMVRAGISMYGLQPSADTDCEKLQLQPAMSWHSNISDVKQLPAGREISYGGTFVTQKDTVVATVPLGYADGYRRSLSNRFYVLIRGKQAPILGRVCMDQFMVDVTDIPNVQIGDPVVLMGTDGAQKITAEQLSAAANSFNYEQVCDISRRVARVYLQGGKQVAYVNYLLDK